MELYGIIVELKEEQYLYLKSKNKLVEKIEDVLLDYAVHKPGTYAWETYEECDTFTRLNKYFKQFPKYFICKYVVNGSNIIIQIIR